MTKLLIRLFVRDWEKVENSQVRGRYGAMAGIVGIFCNLLLFGAKLAIGTISHSVSILADAVNNLSDASSSIITLAGFRLSQRPADEEHPYGHARFEYLSGLGVAALILVIGVQLAKSSVEKILHPTPVEFSAALVIVLVLSILVKLWMALFNRSVGKMISSMSLIATAADSRNDVISTGAVLVAAVIAHLTSWNLDGYIGLLVALFILYSGIGIAKETISPLLGAPADEELVRMIEQESLAFSPKILGIHDLMVHDYGPGQRFATLHAEIDRKEDVMEAHEIIDDVERMFRDRHNIQMVIHYDPIVTDDPVLEEMKQRVLQGARQFDERLRIHDFRMVRGPNHTNLIFDLALPYELRGQEKNIQRQLNQMVQQENMRYYTVITFDWLDFNKT